MHKIFWEGICPFPPPVKDRCALLRPSFGNSGKRAPPGIRGRMRHGRMGLSPRTRLRAGAAGRGNCGLSPGGAPDLPGRAPIGAGVGQGRRRREGQLRSLPPEKGPACRGRRRSGQAPVRVGAAGKGSCDLSPRRRARPAGAGDRRARRPGHAPPGGAAAISSLGGGPGLPGREPIGVCAGQGGRPQGATTRPPSLWKRTRQGVPPPPGSTPHTKT